MTISRELLRSRRRGAARGGWLAACSGPLIAPVVASLLTVIAPIFTPILAVFAPVFAAFHPWGLSRGLPRR
jgi:hypothetical protein